MLLKTFEKRATPYPRNELVHNRSRVIQEVCVNYLLMYKINRTLIHIPTTLTTTTSSISI